MTRSIALSQRFQELVKTHSEHGWEQVMTATGLEMPFHELYLRYRTGDISFGRLAQELGLTVWDLTHLLETMGLPTTNLPK